METRQGSGRIMRKNHSNAIPRHIISFDCETLPSPATGDKRRNIHRFRLATAAEATLRDGKITKRFNHRFYTGDDVWDYVAGRTSVQYTTWLIGHNVLFDLVVSGFPFQLMSNRFRIDCPRQPRAKADDDDTKPEAAGICCIESPPTIIGLRCNETQGRLIIVDSLNWFPTSLAELGDSCGLPKLDFPAFEADDETWFRYCQRDSEIVLTTFLNLIQWVQDNDFGLFRYTGPSQALAAYRHRFLRTPIYIHDNVQCKQLERDSYSGGRTEVFRMGAVPERCHQFDCNSLFPSVMQTGVFPYILDRSDTDRRLSTEFPDIVWADSIAEVELQTMSPVFPMRRKGDTVYPIGRFVTTLAGHELHYAATNSYIRRVGKWATYHCGSLFRHWVDELWQLRQKYKAAGNELYDQFAKRLLNSLYGKFGQRSPAWCNVPGNISALPWSRWIEPGQLPNEVTNFRSIGWNVQRQTEREEIEGSFIAISSFVTAAARMKMNGLRWIAGERNVFYQGCDSLIVNDKGAERLSNAGWLADNEIGKLRWQCSTDDAEILGCADYRLGDKVVIAGKARQFTLDDEGRQLQRKFDATRNLFNERAIDTVDETLEPWTRAGMYKKGTVGDDGWVHPIILGICEAAMAAQGVPF